MDNETKTVYTYNADGKYITTLILDHTDRSPNSGRWQIPRDATEIAPLEEKEGFDRTFDGAAWEYKQIEKEEEPEQPKEPTFTELQSAKLNEIDTWTKQHITGGFISSAKGTPHTYDSADADQLTFAAMYAASKSPDFATTKPYNGQIPIRAVPAGETVKSIIQHSAEEMQKLMGDLALYIGICKQVGWQLQSAAQAAATAAELDTVVWPEVGK